MDELQQAALKTEMESAARRATLFTDQALHYLVKDEYQSAWEQLESALAAAEHAATCKRLIEVK